MKFSKQLQTTKRKWLTELRESDSSLGGWNPDATDSDRPMGDFAEVYNMRKMRPGELETRTGFKAWEAPGPDGGAGDKVVLCKAEYRLDNVFVDVTFFAETVAGTVKVFAVVFHPDTETMQLVEVCSTGNTFPVVCAYQFQTYLVVSVVADGESDPVDTQMYALWASDAALTTWDKKVALGKQVSPVPSSFTFTEQITGDLIAFVPDDVDDSVGSEHAVLSYKRDVEGNLTRVKLALKASYWLSGSAPVEKLPVPLYVWSKSDVPVSEADNSPLHIKSRGWWYRVVLRRKFLDARSQTHIIAEAPSSDFYVEDRCYVPPCLVYNFPEDSTYRFIPSQKANNTIPPVTNTDTPGFCYPTTADYTTLHDKFLSFVGHGVKAPADPLFYVAMSLAAPDENHPDINIGYPQGRVGPHVYGKAPYDLSPGAHDINGAPNAEFTWANFGLDPTTDTTLYSIEFFRTPYSYPDEKDNATKDPLWGNAYNYGFAGRLNADDTKFTDNIADAALLFGPANSTNNPLYYDGYLENQFAGEVMRPYQDHVVLGNVRTKYRVRDPWAAKLGTDQKLIVGTGIQAFAFAVTAETGTNYNLSSLTTYRSDGIPIYAWYYSYVDRDGNESDAVPIAIDASLGYAGGVDGDTTVKIAFLFPRGYSDSVVSVKLYRTYMPLGVRELYLEGTISCATGAYISSGNSGGTDLGAVVLVPGQKLTRHNIKTDKDPGFIIWSKLNNAWEWPQENAENEHDQNPITALDEVIGPLYVFADKGIVLTRLNGYREPVHTSAVTTGCISRYACIKVDQVVFTMTANGLILTGGSGVVPYDANIATEVREYLREQFNQNGLTGQTLTGVRNRVSMSYNGLRNELWIHFPSTIVVEGTLPARTFVVRFFKSEKGTQVFAYEFDITAIKNSGDVYDKPSSPVIFLPHADGSLYSAFTMDRIQNPSEFGQVGAQRLIIQNNDTGLYDWPAHWAFQYQHAMGTPNVSKKWFQFNFLAKAKSKFYLKSGMLTDDGTYDHVNGTMRTDTPLREVAILNAGESAEYKLPISGSVTETSGTPPAVRLYGVPNEFSENEFRIESFDLYFGLLHSHHG